MIANGGARSSGPVGQAVEQAIAAHAEARRFGQPLSLDAMLARALAAGLDALLARVGAPMVVAKSVVCADAAGRETIARIAASGGGAILVPIGPAPATTPPPAAAEEGGGEEEPRDEAGT